MGEDYNGKVEPKAKNKVFKRENKNRYIKLIPQNYLSLRIFKIFILNQAARDKFQKASNFIPKRLPNEKVQRANRSSIQPGDGRVQTGIFSKAVFIRQ